jgi:molybdate transport repressor ModE-like protein
MPVRLTPRWHAGDAVLDARLVPLLRGVAKEGSLNRAVKTLRLSYRHAWGLLGGAERALEQRLVLMERGRGARLSAFAERLLAADDAACSVLERELGAALAALAGELPAARGRPLVVHASHDLALAELRDLLSPSGSAVLDLHFRGSLECLASLARGECDLAGFHVPEPAAGRAAFAPYRPWLRTRGLRLVRFVDRRQGLMVTRGNPKRILGLSDLASKRARFVNRQPGSGTRLCFDRLLAEASMRPAQVQGYQTEEFTHAAVAAIVASGMADAGFGIEAAAHQHGLGFIALATERYFLAARRRTLSRPAAQALLDALRSDAFRGRCLDLPGYDATAAGEILSASMALP